MRNLMWLMLMLVEMVFVWISAKDGDIAMTIAYCFAAYLCLQFMGKDGVDNG